MLTPLTQEEKSILLRLAREGVMAAVNEREPPAIDIETLPPRLRALGASFVTLTCGDQLRGCIGTLKVDLPLAEDVRSHAIAASTRDYRFSPIQADELDNLEIEVSVLSTPHPLDYHSVDDLIESLRPGTDGVILKHGVHRATFLPQVWKKIPDPESFLETLCEKAHLPSDAWRTENLQVLIYQVDSFHEPALPKS
ncbi:MAG: AmmeMemoRadiSam system protein A [Anaerolineales bacterium]|nr:AmmeMemoRadiSam system protein A [Anaerolineales bacterium]